MLRACVRLDCGYGQLSAMTAAAATIPRDRWLRIIPPMIVIYVVAYMDRMNIGFAMAGGMSESLGVTATVSGLAVGIFFAGYLLLQIYGGQVAEYGSAKRFISTGSPCPCQMSRPVPNRLPFAQRYAHGAEVGQFHLGVLAG
jgi:hypothetical protein